VEEEEEDSYSGMDGVVVEDEDEENDAMDNVLDSELVVSRVDQLDCVSDLLVRV